MIASGDGKISEIHTINGGGRERVRRDLQQVPKRNGICLKCCNFLTKFSIKESMYAYTYTSIKTKRQERGMPWFYENSVGVIMENSSLTSG